MTQEKLTERLQLVIKPSQKKSLLLIVESKHYKGISEFCREIFDKEINKFKSKTYTTSL